MTRRLTNVLLTLLLPTAVLAQTGQQEPSSAGGPTLGEMLKLVPDEVALVVVVPGMNEVVAGIREFGTIIGVDELIDLDADELFDELEVRDLAGGWEERIRKEGPFVFALREPDAVPLMICSVTMPANVPSDDLVQFRGQIMIAAPDAEAMRAVKGASGKFAQRFDKQAGATLENHHVAVFLDLAAWTGQIEQMLSLGEMFSQMGAAAATQPAQVNLTMVKWLFQTLRTGFEEGETIVLGGRVNGDGVRLSEVTHFKRSGRVVRYLDKVGKPKKDLLRGLVAEPGMFVMANEWTLPSEVETFTEQLFEVILASVSEQKADESEWKATTQRAMKLYRAISGYNGVMSFSTDPPGMSAAGLYFADNPRAVFNDFSALWKLSAPMMSALAPGFSMDVTERTDTVGSVEARVYRFAFDVDDEQMRAALERIYGKSTTVYVAPHPEGVAYTMGPAEGARQRMERLLAGRGRPLNGDQRVVDALKLLSPRPQAFVLLDLPPLVGWAMGIAGVPPEAMPNFKVPETPVPFISFGLYLHEAACSAELFVPARTVRFVVGLWGGPENAVEGADPY